MDFGSVFDQFIGKFECSVLPFPYISKGIWLSEGFSVCSVASYYDINHIIESGVSEGRSTEIFAKYGCKLTSIERACKIHEVERFDRARKRLSNYDINFICGDSVKIIPDIINKSTDKLGIVIDGPKGIKACDLARDCVRSKNVAFVAIHDQRDHIMSNAFKNVFYTDTRWFIEKFGYLDKSDKTSDQAMCPVMGIYINPRYYA